MVPAKMGLPEGVASGSYDVRSGSKADILVISRHVRFTPKSGHSAALLQCPLSAKSGCEQSQQGTTYSITSSASAKNDSGMVSPSAFAVLRLTTTSNFVGN
jgi:hypothetical protein